MMILMRLLMIIKFKRPERLVKDELGKVITESEKQLNIWVDLFAELLNKPAPDNPATITETDKDLWVDCSPQSKEEIVKAIKRLKNGKAARPDGIPAKALKADVETTADMLLPLFKMIWENEDIQKDRKEGQIIKLPKKRRPQQLRQLPRNKTTIDPRKYFQQSTARTHEGCCK